MYKCKYCGATRDTSEWCDCDETRRLRGLPPAPKTVIKTVREIPNIHEGEKVVLISNMRARGMHRYPDLGAVGVVTLAGQLGAFVQFAAEQCPTYETKFFLPWNTIQKAGRQEQLRFDEIGR